MAETGLGRLIGAGRTAEIFEWDGHAAKLYRSPAGKETAFREAANQALAETLGLPVPAILGVRQIDGSWAIVMERVDAPSFAATMRQRHDVVPHYLEHMAILQHRMHGCRGIRLRSFKTRLAAEIRDARVLDTSRVDALLLRLREMPDGDSLCHGDFHPENVLGDPTKPTIIDWMDAAHGDPSADLCRSHLLAKIHAEAIASPYVDAYCRLGGTTQERMLDWLPFVAAARLAQGFADERDRLMEMIGPS